MNNNNHLCQETLTLQVLCTYGSQNHLSDSLNENSSKDRDSFLKSQVSLADTTCDENSPFSLKFQDHVVEQHSFSLTQFNLEDSSSITEEELACHDYCQNGFCMKGVECGKIHSKTNDCTTFCQKSESPLMFIFKQMPQILIKSKRRAISFLG